MISREKAEKLDEILRHLSDEKNDLSVEGVAKILGIDFHTAFHLSDILAKHNDVIDHRDISSKNGKDKLINITSNGRVFINSEGGFTKLFETQEAERIKEEEFRNLQLKDLKSRVENLEKTFKEQSEFWTSTTEKNKEQIPLIKDNQLITWIALGVAILSLLMQLNFI